MGHMCPGDILIKQAETVRGGSRCQHFFYFKNDAHSLHLSSYLKKKRHTKGVRRNSDVVYKKKEGMGR